MVETNDAAFEISPNPNNGLFSFSFTTSNFSNSDVAILRIVNSVGELVYEKQFNGEEMLHQAIDLGNNASGVYMIQFTVNGTTYSKQVLILQ